MKSGSCLCGEVTYEVHGPLRNVVACDCKQCRKQTGTYMSATAAKDTDVKLTGNGVHRVDLPSRAAKTGGVLTVQKPSARFNLFPEREGVSRSGCVWARRGRPRRPIAGVTLTRERQASGDRSHASYWPAHQQQGVVRQFSSPWQRCRTSAE